LKSDKSHKTISPDVVYSSVPVAGKPQGKVEQLEHSFLQEGILAVQQTALVDLAHVGSVQRNDLVQVSRPV